MQYRLLRNNKESGPYTKAQLEEIGLKPYDLLWIEGRGGAWLYASEIEDLKSIAPAVEEQPYDRFYKGKEKQNATANSKQAAAFSNNTAPTTTATATLKAPKPRIRITGDKVVMIDNAALQQPQPINNIISSFPKEQATATAAKPVVKQEAPKPVQTVGLDWENMYSDWKGDEKVAEEKTAAPTKAQTMEEVRQRYEEAKQKQLDEKQNTTTSTTRQNIMAGIAVLVLAIGGYAGYKLNSGSSITTRSTQVAPTVEKAEVVQDENNTPPKTSDVSDANTTTQQPASTNDNVNNSPANEIKSSINTQNTKPVNTVPAPVENKNANTTESKKEEAAPVKNTPIPAPVKVDEKATKPEAAVNKSKVANAVPANSNTATASNNKLNNTEYDINKPVATSTQAPVAAPPVVKQPEATAKKISDYIAVNKLGGATNSGSVQNVLLSVKNVTDFPIDLAVIDIQYYGANGRYQKGETMYVKNIGAGSNVNVRIPDGKTARSISYKVSLVSSEQKTLYLVGD